MYPRVWELQIGTNSRARLRIDQAASSKNLGRLKVYSTISGGASGEQLEYDLGSIIWDGTHLSFVQHVGSTVRTYTATASGRTLSGSYSPGNVAFTGTRAEVLTHGMVPKSQSGMNQWAKRTRTQLFHLTMGDNPQPLTSSVTVLGTNLVPTPSVSLPPDRDDNPAAWPQSYTMTELQFNYTLPNPYGGAPIARTSHGYLAVPTGPPPASGQYRALLAVNGHNGSGWAMMNPDDEYFWYGDSYARRGYVVLALDISHRPLVDRSSMYTDYLDGDDPAHGNGVHPAVKATGFDSDWEEDGERGWDAMRAMDYLLSLPYVDPARVVVSGISMGGEVTGIAGGLDTRLAMSIVAGYSPDEGVMLYNGNHPCWEWQHGDIREYVDVADYLALTARALYWPRPDRWITPSRNAIRLFPPTSRNCAEPWQHTVQRLRCATCICITISITIMSAM